ncbi:DUF2339 domain-containing protein [Psychromonas ossibalaenae]|uniref:DUF2339 domain-containing protein n=1 Tax=Psychromonas ossibalaenae TaxID=444922 RepID=UPI0003A8E7FF|nr:DUF2339 domain-containing protein [Psychromonas ossibalaenae]
MQLKDELLHLRAELDLLRTSQDKQQQNINKRFDDLSLRLEQLSLLSDSSMPPSSTKQSRKTVQLAIKNGHAAFQADKNETLRPGIEKITADIFFNSEESIREQNNDKTQPELRGEITREAVIQLGQSGLLGRLSEFGGALFGPFSAVSAQIHSFYKHYQQRGLGPVFLMTVVGIITLTVGFAYLLQYSINNWFSELAKALLGFTAANAVLLLAVFIRKKRPGMEDFSSGLVGLGLILNYLCTYFIGPYFELIPSSMSFLLLLLITSAGFVISMKLETRVIAVVALLGGSLAPIMLLFDSQAPLLYLPYLLLIGCCAVVQSRMLNWPALMEVTALVHIACIELFMLYLGRPFASVDWQVLAALFSVNVLFYVYALTAILAFNKSKQLSEKSGSYNKVVGLLPFALLAFVLLTITQLSVFSGEIFLANSLFSSAGYLFFRRYKQLRPILLVFAASFAGFAALQLVSRDFLGLVLLLEGTLLLWLGAKDSYLTARSEAYLLLATGLLVNIAALSETVSFSLFNINDFDSYAFSLIILSMTAAALYTSAALMRKLLFESDQLLFTALEGKIWIVIKELLSLSYATCLLFSAYLLNDQYFVNISPLISLLLLYLAAKDKLKLTEITAWLLFLPLLALTVLGIMDSGSYSFTHQPLYAQLARVELFVCLLLTYYWYRRYFADSKIIKLAYRLQLLCLLAVPLLFLPKVLRLFTDYISIALWLSTFISLMLARYIKHRALILEAKILTISAIIITALSCLFELWQGLAALAVGGLFMGFLLYRYLYLDRIFQLVVRLQWQLTPYYFALVAAVITHSLMSLWQSNWAVAAAVLCAYFALLLRSSPTVTVLRASYSCAYVLLFVFAAVPVLMHSQLSFSLSVESLIFVLCEISILFIVGRLIFERGAVVRVHRKSLPLDLLRWGWHILLGLSYLLWSYQLNRLAAAPLSAILLVIHGSALMFISLRVGRQGMIRLAGIVFALACIKVLFVDMASFEIIQKVIAFMVIGAILLSVSYFYQKVRNKQQASAINDKTV